MSASSNDIKIKVIETYRLVKWDAALVGDDPPDPTKIDASQHPACLEIVEVDEHGRVNTVFRRE